MAGILQNLPWVLLISFVQTEWTTNEPFVAQRYISVIGARGMYVDDAGDVLVVSQNLEIRSVYEEENGDGTINVVSARIVDTGALNVNHGIVYHNGYLYASSASAVYRWPYIPGQRKEISTPFETVIEAFPNPIGGHSTRTLIFDSDGLLYVSIGSSANVDPNSNRARIRRFAIDRTLPQAFNDGEVFADGLRNEVGLAFDSYGILWGVENGADQLIRDDLGGDIHNGNPAEEMNRFNRSIGQHYGYPYCFSSHDLEGYEKGTQFAWPTFMNDGIHTDEWCRDPVNNQPPALAMPAHNAPLGIEFYKGQNCDSPDGAFPCSATGDAIVVFHGSKNRDIGVGHRVGWFPMDKVTGDPLGEDINIVYEPNADQCGGPCFRPVNAVFNNNGHLIVSDDDSGFLLKVTYNAQPKLIRERVFK